MLNDTIEQLAQQDSQTCKQTSAASNALAGGLSCETVDLSSVVAAADCAWRSGNKKLAGSLIEIVYELLDLREGLQINPPAGLGKMPAFVTPLLGDIGDLRTSV